MKQSHLFTKTRKEAPAGEEAKNAQLLIRGGFIHKEMAGVYSFLPLGLRVLRTIENIVREEMNAIGGQEVLLSALQDKSVWEKTDRWEVDEVWFKTALNSGSDLGLGFTHEEPLTGLLSEHLQSYRDLPLSVYQIQNKFRNELRAKSGLLRGREFIMKDMYSFSRDEDAFNEFYERVADAYVNIFERAGIGEYVYRTRAGGGTFSDFSDEFQALCETGEDTVYVDRDKRVAVNEEVYTDDVVDELGLSKDDLEKHAAIEVGNIFPLGTRFSEALGLNYRDKKGDEHPVVMGSYGIGIGRLMATAVELLSDENGIVWPESIAPFAVHIVGLAPSEGKGVRTEAEKLYMELIKNDVEVLIDDRDDVSAGEKLAEADLIGIPWRVVVSERSLEKGGFELKKRNEQEAEFVKKGELLTRVSKPN